MHYPKLTYQERVARIEELQGWLADHAAEYEGVELPAVVRSNWDQNQAELNDLRDDQRDADRRTNDLRDGLRNGRYQTESGSGSRIDDHPSRVAFDGDKPLVRLTDGRAAAVERGRSFRDHPVVRDQERNYDRQEEAVIGMHGSFGNLIRAMSTSSGSAVVPTIWASNIIDRARNIAAVMQAGAQVVPMDANVVKMGRLTVDPTAAFRAEGSTVGVSDPTFDNVTLTSRTLSALVVGSLEWFADAPNVDQVVSEAIAKAIALEIDRQALFGGVIAGAETGATGFNTTFPVPPNPQGVLANLLANAASSVLGGGANGTIQTAATFWNEILDTALQPTLFNEVPNAVLWTPQAAKFYAKVYDTTNQPLKRPPILDQFGFFNTGQIPAAMTQGTSTTNQTDVFAGDWSQLIIGQRLGFTVQTLVERYAELGQIGIVAPLARRYRHHSAACFRGVALPQGSLIFDGSAPSG